MNAHLSVVSAIEELEELLSRTHDLRSRQQIEDILAAYRVVLAEHEPEVWYE